VLSLNQVIQQHLPIHGGTFLPLSNDVKLEPHVIVEQRDFWMLLTELRQSHSRKLGKGAAPFGIALSLENGLALLLNAQLNSHAWLPYSNWVALRKRHRSDVEDP
jgi:hypothetical protein